MNAFVSDRTDIAFEGRVRSLKEFLEPSAPHNCSFKRRVEDDPSTKDDINGNKDH